MRGAGPRGARERGRARAGVRGGDICGVQSVRQSPTGSGFTWALGLWSPHFSVVSVVSVWGLSPGAGSTAPTLRPFHLSPPDSRPPAFCEGQFGHLFFPKRVTRIIQATYSQLIQAELVCDKDRGSSTTSVAQISQGEDKMTKRKKLRTSGEGLCPPKPLKNPRLGDFDGDPQSSMLGCLHHPEEPEGKLGPVPSTQQHGEEPGKAVSSSPDEETGSPCRLLRQPEKEPAPLPPSQDSFGRFVPQFAKSRKTVTRKEEMKDEDRGSGAFSLETIAESSAQSPGCQLLVETLGVPLQEATELGDPTQADSARPEQSSQSPVQAVPGSGDSQPDDPPDRGTGLSASQRASQDHLSEQGADDSKPETDRVPGPCVNQKQEPGPAQEEAELGGQNLERDLEGLRVSPQASVVLEHREIADDPLQEPGAQQGIPDTTSELAGQRDHSPHSADQGTWADSLAVELDFLLDSQIQDALDASDFEAPPEQLFPSGNKPGPCWPGPSSRAIGDPVAVAKAQPSRLIMGTHRDLEAFKRLNYRKTKPGGKAPLPYPSKGPGNIPRGDPPWREL
nr:break repair meiotic recombinase recruitment factor 1 isoform X6 [Pan troglodytes]